MAGSIFAMTSHKGGTGRTVATANIAYQLVLRGLNVCCVDLDLTSPTFGAVLGMEGFRSGAEEGVHDLLPQAGRAAPKPATSVRQLLKNVWAFNQDRDFQATRSDTVGMFDLLPGKKRVDWVLGNEEQMAPPLTEVLTQLAGRYNAVFVDVRSGYSDAASALLLSAVVDRWIVFYRWTPQHMVGAGDLLGRLPAGTVVHAVRVAYGDPVNVGAQNRQWFVQRDGELKQEEEEVILSRANQLPTIPLDPVLQWREKFLLESDVRRGIARQETLDAYSRVATALVEPL